MTKRAVPSVSVLGIALFALAAPATAPAQEAADPVLVRDVDPSTVQGSSVPRLPVEVGDLAVFTAADPLHGRELWVTDATEGGTRRLADICPGPCSTGIASRWVADRRYFFLADPEEPHLPATDPPAFPLGRDLWTTDGTPGGTRFLAAVDGVSHLASLELTGVHLFLARDEEHGAEPWRTDGTPEGTFPLGDFVPGPGSSIDGSCGGATALEDHVLLALRSPESGCELWRSDGSAAGTTLVRDIEAGAGSSAPAGFATLGDRVLFLAIEEGHGNEIFITDGTRSGTRRLLEIAPGGQSTVFHTAATPLTFHVDGASAHFLAATRAERDPETGLDLPVFELWRTDGTAGGTRRLTSFGHPLAFRRHAFDNELPFYFGGRFLARGSTLYFDAADASGDRELWTSDGTPAGTRRFRDLCPGECSSLPRDLRAVGPPGGIAFSFTATDGAHGREVWVSDGSAAGTRRVADVCAGECGSEMLGTVLLGDVRVAAISPNVLDGNDARIWALGATPASTRELERFEGAGAFADRGVLSTTIAAPMARAGDGAVFPITGDHGRELWVTRGTPASTRLLADLVGEIGRGSNARAMVASAGRVFFLANDGSAAPGRDEVWVTDGSAAGTRPVADAPLDCQTCEVPPIRDLHPAGGLVFYWVEGGIDGDTLWRTDGTPAGTFPLTGPHRGAGTDFVEYRGAAYFQAGSGLWRTDGTPEGTEEVVGAERIGPPIWLTVHGGDLYFGARPAAGGGVTLWRTDGTAAATRVVADGLLLGDHRARAFPRIGNLLFFVAFDDDHGEELWTSDGSAAGTRRVADLRPGPAGSNVRVLGAIGDRLVFETTTPADGLVLRATDGTAAGTVPLRSFATSANGHEVLTIGGRLRLLFSGNDETRGRELWITDGRPAGTRRVKDLVPGPGWSDPTLFTPAGGLLFFQAFGTGHGNQVWRSDGSAEGTWAVTSVEGGVALPEIDGSMAPLGDRLVFAGIDLEHGREPWSLPLDAGPAGPASPPDGPGDGSDPPPPAGAWLTSDAVPGFRFKVRIAQGAAGPIAGTPEPLCIPETLCVSGALPGRSEVFLRVVGPRPNGKLWPTLVKFTTSEVEVWIEQLATGAVRYYRLEGASPGVDELPGLFDRDGFDP